jgi:hypothetical protein
MSGLTGADSRERRKRNGGCVERSRTDYVVDDTDLEHSRQVWKEEEGALV